MLRGSHVLFIAIALLAVGLASAQTKAGGTIQGRLLRSTGRPLPYTELELVPTHLKKLVNDSALIAVSDTRGRFAFSKVPPGKYTLSINFDDKPTELSPYPTYYYPGSDKRYDAAVFDVTDKTLVKDITFTLVPEMVPRSISGTVTWRDGRPVANAYIAYRDVDFDLIVSFGDRRSDAQGRFRLDGFVGRSYEVGAILVSRPNDFYNFGEILGGGETGVFTLQRETQPLTVKIGLPEKSKELFEKYMASMDTPWPNDEAF